MKGGGDAVFTDTWADRLSGVTRRLPIAAKMVLGITLVGVVALVLVYAHEQVELQAFHEVHLLEMLQEGGEDDRSHLEQHFNLYRATAQVYGQCFALRDHLTAVAPKWSQAGELPPRVVSDLPPWFPSSSLIRALLLPRFALLVDEGGRVREIFHREPGELPDFQAEMELLLRKTGQHPERMTLLGGRPFLVAVVPVQAGEVRATLILADPLDDLFLREAVNPTVSPRIVAMMDNGSGTILASSRPERIPSGSSLGTLDGSYMMTPKNHLSLVHSELDLGFVSFVNRKDEEQYLKKILYETSKHRLYYGLAFVFSALLITSAIAARLRGLTRELTIFAEISLGSSCLIAQDGDEVHRLHEISQELQRKIIHDRSRQTAGFEDLAMHMHISRILRSGGGYREVLEMALDVILNLVELNPPHAGCVLFLRVDQEVIFTENFLQIVAERGALPRWVRAFAEDPAAGRCLHQRLSYSDDVFLATECIPDAEAVKQGDPEVQTWAIPLKHANQLFGALILLSSHNVTFSLERFRTLRLVGETIAAHLHAESLTASLRERHQALALTLEETQAATNALRRSENRLSGILAMLPALFIEVDAADVVCQWNQMATRLTGIPAEQARGMNFRELPISWEWEAILHLLQQAGEAGMSRHAHRIPCRLSGGKEGLLDVTITPLRVEEHGGYILMALDVTERASMEVRLSHAQKMEAIGTLAAGIAHEINTPTQFIGDNTHFLKDAFADLNRLLESWRAVGEDPSKGMEETRALEKEYDLPYLQTETPAAISQILQGVERISTIVRAMKDFSYPDQGIRTKVDLNKAIMDTVTIARNEYKYVAELETELAPELPMVSGYRNELNQAFLNILVNAAHTIADKKEKMGVERGRITISTALEGEEVVIRFTDTGMGIPEHLRLRIFEPFFTTKVVGKGTGQGLAIVHSVVAGKHGGNIQVEGAVGTGTTFVLRLPLNETQPTSRTEA